MKLTGLIAATHTPFDSNGELNLEVVSQQAAWLLENGIQYAFIGGSTGESHSLSLDERLQLAKRWIEVSSGSELNVVIHVGGNCLRDSGVLAQQAENLGATAISALAPSYFKPADVPDLIDSMNAIASKAPSLPFYYYDIPALTQVNHSMPQFLHQAAAKIPNLVGIKFTNQDFVSLQECLAADSGGWDILWGVDESLLAALALGVNGAVGSSYNFAPNIYQKLMAAYQVGDIQTARQQQLNSIKLINAIAKYGYLPAAKYVMELLGVPVGIARLPLKNLDSTEKKSLQEELERLGFFERASR